MLGYFRSFQSASKETRRFVITIAMIGVILVATTFYAYWRLSTPHTPRYQLERSAR